jgi:KUP system potassium uptake protein
MKSLDNADQQSRRWSLMGMFITLGIVFGDIGTSPLYVMKTIVKVSPGYDATYIIGAVSCIIWTLTLQTTLKYVVIALRADNKGEGGILALYALVRHSRKRWLYLLAIIGASTLVADGIITPSITVLSAIEGLGALHTAPPVVPISIAIISVLFFIQQFGTHTIGRSFGYIMFLWFLMLGVMGGLQLPHHWAVLRAFNPYYALQLLSHNPSWFLILGAVFLCTTGAEALYSDLGHCGKRNITWSWAYVKLMLVLNYLGQGAWLIAHAGSMPAGLNPFYAIMPRAMLIPAIVMATLAAVIASQALISGSFTIFSEAMNLDFWPRMRIKYPTREKGQMFVPWVNTSLYLLCILTILLFQTSENMEAAYGLSITITMLMTTVLLTFYLQQRHVARPLVFVFVMVFGCIEGLFFVANVFKFFHGGWFTLLLAGLFCTTMYVWHNAIRIRKKHLQFHRIRQYFGILQAIKDDSSIPMYATNLVYISKTNNPDLVEGKVIYSIIHKTPKRAKHYWLFHFEYVDEPDRLDYTFTPLIAGTLFRVDVHIGFRVQPHLTLYLRQIVEDLVAEGRFDLVSGYRSLADRHMAGDFRFVVIHRIFYPFSSADSRDNFIMGLYAIIKHIGISEERALGLDTSSVMVERVPLIVAPRTDVRRIVPTRQEQAEEEDVT